MKIQLCSITGVDNTVSPLQLANLSTKYPYVEWGISYDLENLGKPRYPSPEWINSFHDICTSPHKAIHLSGEGLTSFVSAQPITFNHLERFERIQINLDNAQDRSRDAIAKLAKQMRLFPGKKFILGTNEDTIDLLPYFADINMALLFDSSGGTGTQPNLWPSPLMGYECGYAGGINPENIDETLEALNKVVPANQKIWIDMESGVRSSQNTFDVHKAETILKQVGPWIV